MSIDTQYEKKLLQQQLALKGRMIETINRSVKDLSDYLSRYSKKFPEDYKSRITFINRSGIKRQLMAQMKQLVRELDQLTTDATEQAWHLAVQKNEIITKQFITGITLPVGLASSYFGSNIPALESYLKNASTISESVLNYTGLFQKQIENYVSSGIIQGKGAREIATQLKAIALNPMAEFKALQKATGVVMQMPSPGSGVYKSIFKNLFRISRTETNIAYRLSDDVKRNQLDFIVGFEIHLSDAHEITDICDAMSGSYPVSFVFCGWHPNCFCYTVDILATKEEFKAWIKGGMKGEIIQSQRMVTKIPEVARNYVLKNEKKLVNSYFYRDNFAGGKLSKAVKNENILGRLNNPKDLMKMAKNSGKEVDALGKNLASKYGGTVTPVNYKSKESILRKTAKDYNGDFSKINDAVRNTIIVPKDKIAGILKDLESNPNIISIKSQTLKNSPMGYTGTICNIRTKNGLIAEIQINTKEMIYGKENPLTAKNILGEKTWNEIAKEVGNVPGGLGHKYYEQWRVLDMVKEADIMRNLEQKSWEYYKNFR